MPRRARRCLVVVMAMICGIVGAPSSAAAHDETNLQLVYAEFIGTATVRPADNGPLDLDVYASPNECTAVVVVGAGVPTTFQCSFELSTLITPVAYCSGERITTGRLFVYRPEHTHEFDYAMRVVVEETFGYGFGGVTVGGVGTGYAEFSFGGTTCSRRVPAPGTVEY